MAIMAMIAGALLYAMAPFAEKRPRFYFALLACAVLSRFLLMPDLIVEFAGEDYDIYISASRLRETSGMAFALTPRPVFLHRGFMMLAGFRTETLFALMRFLSALAVPLTYLNGCALLKSHRAAALAAAGMLLCPAHLLFAAAVTRHLPAVALLLLALFLLLTALAAAEWKRDLLVGTALAALALATLQKVDFIFFPFLFFLVWALYARPDAKLTIGKCVVVLALGLLTVAAVWGIDNALDLGWSSGQSFGKFQRLQAHPPAQSVYSGFIGSIIPFLFLAPALPWKALGVLEILSGEKGRAFRWIAAACFGIFIIQYLPTGFGTLEKKTIKALVLAPVIYMAAGAYMDALAARGRRGAALAIGILCLASSAAYYPFIRNIARISPRVHDWKAVRAATPQADGCTMLTIDYPYSDAPVYTLMSAQPAGFSIADFTSVLVPGSTVYRQTRDLHALADSLSSGEWMKTPGPAELAGYYLYFYRQTPYRFEPIVDEQWRRQAVRRLEAIHAMSPPGGELPETVFRKGFLESLARGECYLLFKDSTLGSYMKSVPLDTEYRLAFEHLETTLLASEGDAGVYRILGPAPGKELHDE